MTLRMKIQEERAEAKEEGRKEERKRVAIELLNSDFPLEKIAQISRLPLEEVKTLAARIDYSAFQGD